MQRSAGNRAVARLLAPAQGARPIPGTGQVVIRRWFDDEWRLPEEEQTFEGWLEVYWDHLDWISQEHYDEVRRLYDLVLAAQGDEEEAEPAHDAAYNTFEANHLVPGSDAWERAVSAAATSIEQSGGVAEADTIAATWPGRVPDEVPDEYTEAVGKEVRERAAAKQRAQADQAEAARQQREAADKALRDRQTRRIWTGRQVISTCGYGGKTSVHPYWGGRNLMINQRRGLHFTQFHDNYDPNQLFGSGTDIQTVIDAVFGGKGGENCLHVTQEVFGEKDKRNPHYFLSGTYRPAAEKSKQVEEKSKAELKQLMDDEKQRITNLLRLTG
jgi:hypothetical protein